MQATKFISPLVGGISLLNKKSKPAAPQYQPRGYPGGGIGSFDTSPAAGWQDAPLPGPKTAAEIAASFTPAQRRQLGGAAGVIGGY